MIQGSASTPRAPYGARPAHGISAVGAHERLPKPRPRTGSATFHLRGHFASQPNERCLGVAWVPGSSLISNPKDGEKLIRSCFQKKMETLAEAVRRLGISEDER